MSADEAIFEYNAYFSGTCTCDHDEIEHGWGECGMDNGECQCKAGWEE